MMCKDCPHFKIDYEPIRGFEFGRASCSKHNLVVDFMSRRKLKRLTCIEEMRRKGE